ncbi:MAG: PQQ-binding-like beta-propeller repeat protein [Planctomycetota bacterium]
MKLILVQSAATLACGILAGGTPVRGMPAIPSCQALQSTTGAALDRKADREEIRGWLSWRGPAQNGTSPERDLPDRVTLDGRPPSWTHALAGRGTPVIANGRVYTLGYEGERAELQELLVCLDEQSGRRIWEHHFSDFISDVIYYRYNIGSPTVDQETGNVLCMSSAGLLSCFTAGGKLLWQHSMMSEYGRLTFPNGRTGSPLVDGDLAIVHCISTSWGSHGPARDRFYAFDKKTGESVWSSTPGGPPKDSSFSFPVVARENGRRVLYAGLGGGHLVCVDVRTGEPIWRFRMATGGVNSSALVYKDLVIAIHGKENVDDSTIGRMVALERGAQPASGVLDRSRERWRNQLSCFTSSPVLVGNRVYQTVHTGELCSVDAESGRILWHEKLAPDQIHASPVWGDGKLYVPMNNGSFYVIRPADEGPEILQKVRLEGNCLGAPAIARGRIYVHTTEKLYCFARDSGEGAGGYPRAPSTVAEIPAARAVRLQVIPADVLLRQGDTVVFRVRSLDAKGLVVDDSPAELRWTSVPEGGVTMSDRGVMKIATDARPQVAVMKVAANGLTGSARIRIVPDAPYKEDFEDLVLHPHPREEGVQSAFPRPWWIGAKLKWEIRERDGNKVLAKTLDRPLFQRTMSLIGHPDLANYTMQVDILSDGNRRSMSTAGVVNQRYLILLKGNYQELEVSSNMELLKESVPFRWQRGTWYTLRTRVDIEPDGTGWIRAKAWQRGTPEPSDWTIQVRHSHAHTHGSPGLYGFSPQSRFRVYLDNISVAPND